MEIDILNEKENPLFKRKEIKISIDGDVPPKKQDLKNLLAEKFSVSPESIVLKKILGSFGTTGFSITANIYSSPEEREKIEGKQEKEIQPNESQNQEQPKPEENKQEGNKE